VNLDARPAPVPDALRHEQEAQLRRAWAPPPGWRRLSAVNNNIIGIWYTAAAFLFLLFGGSLALLMRAQLAVPENTLLTADQYNQVFTMHGTVMMFLFAVPVFEAASILLLPQMLGTREMPFPRLSAFGFWCYVIGGTFVAGSILFGAAPRGGWFMYPPLSSEYDTGIGADIWLLGLSFVEISAIAAAVELIVGVLKSRAPGMRINLIPLYAWYVLVVAGMILFAFPPLIAGDLLLELERTLGWPLFNASRGGDPILWQHLFWIFGHPEVYIIFLPSVALVAMIVPTFARRPMVGYSWIVLAAVGTGFLSFGLWVHHMFTTGLPGISIGLFSAASLAVAIPTGVQIFCFLATLAGARRVRSVPMLFIFGGLATFVIGGFTGVMVAVAPFDFQAHDTYFVVAHLHTVLIGGSVFPIMAGLYYFYPMARGLQLSDRLGRIAFWLVFVGFNVTFMPMHLTGLRGMVRRVYTYPDDMGFTNLNLLSTAGGVLLAAGFLVITWDVLRARTPAPRNPWGGGTLEWLTTASGVYWGVRSIPIIRSRYPLWDQETLVRDVDEGRYYLPGAPEGRREMLITSIIDATPVQCLRVPGPSFLPLLAAIFTAGVFIFATFYWWWPALASGVLALAAILAWLWTGTAQIPERPSKDVGLGVTLPLYESGANSVGWWAMFITMLGDMTAFIALVFGYFFYWTTRDDFLSTATGPGILWPMLALGFAVTSWLATILARHANRVNRAPWFYVACAVALVAALLSAAAFLIGPAATGLNPERDAYAAIVWVLAIWVSAHLATGALMQAYCLARRAAGRLTGTHDIDIANVTLYWHFAALTAIITAGVVAGFPAAAL
jgi:cytochrome c oxidase subunit I+III